MDPAWEPDVLRWANPTASQMLLWRWNAVRLRGEGEVGEQRLAAHPSQWRTPRRSLWTGVGHFGPQGDQVLGWDG